MTTSQSPSRPPIPPPPCPPLSAVPAELHDLARAMPLGVALHGMAPADLAGAPAAIAGHVRL